MCTEAGWRHAGRGGAPRAAARPARAAYMHPFSIPMRRMGQSEPLQVGRHGQQGAHDLAPVLGERHGEI